MDDNRRTERFRWHWVVGSALSGTTLLVTAYIGALRWEWSSIATGIMVGLGAPLVLAFILFLFERRFTQNVADRVKGATEELIESRASHLDSRIDDLESRLEARNAAVAAAQDSLLDEVVRATSFESMLEALEEAERVGAIGGYGLTVPASKREPRLAMHFVRQVRQSMSPFDPRDDADALVYVGLTAREHGGKPNCSVGVVWEESMSSEEVYDDLRAQLQRIENLAAAKAFDFAFAIHEFHRGVRMVLDDHRAPAGQERLHGKLYEIIDDEWIITSAGVENIHTGFLQMPDWESDRVQRRSTPGVESYHTRIRVLTGDPPEGVDQTVWEYIKYRVRHSDLGESYVV